jgi:hypothetical protein
MKPAAKKVTDTKKPSSKPKVFVDTLYGNKILLGQVSIKQDKTTGKINLSQEFDKEATQPVPNSKEPKARRDNQDKKKSTVPSESSGGQKPTDSTKPMGNENNKTTGTRVPDLKGSQSSNDVSSRRVLPAQGKVPPNQPAQNNPSLPSNKKLTAEQWGAKLVSKHQEMIAKERLIREGKSHPDPKDPKFPQYFKEKAIKSTHQEGGTSGNNDGENSKNAAENPSIATPTPRVTPKRGAGLCTTITNMFSPGGTKPNGSPSSSASSASYVDPDSVNLGAKEGTKENTTGGEGDPEKTIDPNVTTLEDPIPDAPDPIKPGEDNSTTVIPPGDKVVKEHTVTVIEETKTDISNEGSPPQNRGNSDDITSNPPEEPTGGSEDNSSAPRGESSNNINSDDATSNPPEKPIGGNEDNASTPRDGSLNTDSEQWQTILDKRTAKKNKKARKNKEKQLNEQAKLLRRQAKYGPEWAQKGGILPASSGSASTSPRRSSSDSNQNSQSPENSGGDGNSNGSPGDPREPSDPESPAEPSSDPNPSGESQGGGDDETKTEGSNNGDQSDFHYGGLRTRLQSDRSL